MNIFREKCQSDLLAFLGIIRGMNLKFPSRCGERDLVRSLRHLFRLKIIIHADVHALVFVAQFPSLGICPCLDIRIKRLGFHNLVH